jgi:hypothetical protein
MPEYEYHVADRLGADDIKKLQGEGWEEVSTEEAKTIKFDPHEPLPGVTARYIFKRLKKA